MKPFEIVRPVFPSISEIAEDFDNALKSGEVTNNSMYVLEFERKLAEYLGVKYCAVFNNGEQALISMLNAGNVSGEVITPAYTYCGTTHALGWNNLTPVFADINPETLTIDTDNIRKLITKHTSAILAAPLYGNPCNNNELEKIANEYGLKLFFDSASAFGSQYDGIKIGNFGEGEIFSFHATKVFPTMEGGAFVTNNKEIFEKVVSLRNFGKNYRDADCDFVGLNGKMMEISAIIGLKLLPNYDNVIKHRSLIANYYKDNLKEIESISFQKLQESKLSISTWLYFQFFIDENVCGLTAPDIIEALKKRNINARRFLYPSNHLLTCYNNLPKVTLPITEEISKNSVALPLYNDMTYSEVDQIVNSLKQIFKV